MAITPSDVFGVGIGLLNAKGEANCRSAASRFFYAAYHCSDAWLNAMPGMASNSGPDGGYHQDLINKLISGAPGWTPEQKRRAKMLGYKLTALKNRRVISDYHLSTELQAGDFEAQRVMAKEAMELCTLI